MQILIAYIAVARGPRTVEYLYRFRDTFERFEPGADCRVVVVSNGGPLPLDQSLWVPTNWTEYARSNDGWDIGGWIDVAQEMQPEFMVCLGESAFFHKSGWLKRLVEARQKHGPGMYGCLSNNLVRPHLITTAFAIDGSLLAAYPERITTRKQRHEWEHGAMPFWERVRAMGKAVKFVTFDGEYSPQEWRAPRDIMWSGTQKNLLVWCNHTDRFFNANLTTKIRWERNADRGL